MVWAATARKAEAQGGGVSSLNVSLNSTVAGNQILAGASVYNDNGPTAVAVSDGANGSYASSFVIRNGVQTAALRYVASNAGGNLTLTFTPSGGSDSSYDYSVYVHEFSGGDTAALASGTPATNTGSGTTASTGSMSPAHNDVLLIAVDGHPASGTVSENAGSEGFTLSNDHESGSAAEPGSMVYKIISGAPGTPSHSWTVPSSTWAAGIAAFKAADGGAADVSFVPPASFPRALLAR